MKHSIIGKKSVSSSELLLQVQLISETNEEAKAIENFELMIADDSQKEMIENYLLFGLKTQYSILGILRQTKTLFTLKVSIH